MDGLSVAFWTIALGSLIENKDSFSLVAGANSAGIDTGPTFGFFEAALIRVSKSGIAKEMQYLLQLFSACMCCMHLIYLVRRPWLS